MALISSLRALLTKRCLASRDFLSNSGETMMALKAWPQPPDMSWMEMWVVEGRVLRSLDSSDSGVIWLEEANSAAVVSVWAAMGVASRVWEVVKSRAER